MPLPLRLILIKIIFIVTYLLFELRAMSFSNDMVLHRRYLAIIDDFGSHQI